MTMKSIFWLLTYFYSLASLWGNSVTVNAASNVQSTTEVGNGKSSVLDGSVRRTSTTTAVPVANMTISRNEMIAETLLSNLEGKKEEVDVEGEEMIEKKEPMSTTGDKKGKSNSIPVIDLSRTDHERLAQEIAQACSMYGFFQVTSHGISSDLINEFRRQCKLFFDLDYPTKLALKRNACNARGYFDDELTKQKRDWKECLDVGVPGSRNWEMQDESPTNGCLDGINQFPSSEFLPNFRRVVVDYFQACAELSHRLAVLMSKGFHGQQQQESSENAQIVDDLKKGHTSYLRMNYYPPCRSTPTSTTTTASLLQNNIHENGDGPLGVSPHKDAGFLTVLLQDEGCDSLQVLLNNDNGEHDNDDKWISATPVPGSLTINTGDMAQIWSNGQYKAPLHRVLTNSGKHRYSAPFFYNPGYKTIIEPVDTATAAAVANDNDKKEKSGYYDQQMQRLQSKRNKVKKYEGVLWGYFRAIRFAGDLTDLGEEIQIEDFESKATIANMETMKPSTTKSRSPHLERQKLFLKDDSWFHKPFSVDNYRQFLKENE